MDRESAIPPHLRRFVVRQDYGAYTEEDHAVWRFVVLQTHARLLSTAHEAYGPGFEATGISVDRIPRIEEMSERLSRFGLRAVCVDGFVPPRAFQAFQANGILPIAADIRTSAHLTYTPAPDIIHEAAGHAPLLAEPDYARYVQRIGEVAEQAFGLPADRAVYETIYALSEAKENPSSTAAEVLAAERALDEAKRAVTVVSESAKIARLYWWTAEYGLVGRVNDYRLYGAGLLSSIGEGHFCRHPSVRKLPLSPACVETDYDITSAQPQLFVAKSFEDLGNVLDEVSATLAFRIGGDHALSLAQSSEETATFLLDSGVEVVGRVTAIHRDAGRPVLMELSGPAAVAHGGARLGDTPRPSSYVLPLGTLADGTPLSELTPDALGRSVDGSARLVMRLASGVEIRGHVLGMIPIGGRVGVVLAEDVEMTRHGSVVFRHEGPYPLALGRTVVTARAGAVTGFFDATPPSDAAVPRARRFRPEDRERIGLYEDAIGALRESAGGDVARRFARIAARLDAEYPDEWLLRWNLLESLVKLGEKGDLPARLERSLERLELRFDHLEPIATGLSYVRSLAGGPTAGRRAHAG